jgi:hypothetical protein
VRCRVQSNPPSQGKLGCLQPFQPFGHHHYS